MDWIANQLIIASITDDTGVQYKKLRSWLSKKESIEAAYKIIDSYLQEGAFEKVKEELGKISQQFTFTPAQQIAFLDFQALKELQIAWATDGKSITDLNANEINQLVSIADRYSGMGSFQAQNILEAYYGFDYYLDPILPDNLAKTESDATKPNLAAIIQSQKEYLLATPNPASDQVLIEYRFLDTYTKRQLVFYDLYGRPLHQVPVSGSTGKLYLDVGAWGKGVYFYTIVEDGKMLISKRLIVQ